MTANSERKKRKKKENLLFSLASMEKKRKEKGELERERDTFELASFVSSPLFIKSLGNASRYENVFSQFFVPSPSFLMDF